MIFRDVEIFSLSNFEGPLDFLIYLIQKDEIDLSEITLQALTQQFLDRLESWKEKKIDVGSEFVAATAYLMWLKSKMLLPHEELSVPSEIEEEDPHFEIIHHLIDYCRFKQSAKQLIEREESQSACFFRNPVSSPSIKKPLGIDHLSLEELSQLFKEMIQRADLSHSSKSQIHEENWKVADKIQSIRGTLKIQRSFELTTLFSKGQSRIETIVTFLAVLELMKIGEIAVVRENELNKIIIVKKDVEK